MSSNSDFVPGGPFQPPTVPPTVRPLSARERVATEALAASLLAVQGILRDAELTSGLHRRGFNAAEFEAGLTLQTAAEEVFVTCRSSLGALDIALAAFEEAWVCAREDYLEFRSMARSIAQEIPPAELGVAGTVMPGFDPFVAQAGASYAAAQAPRFADTLARQGFDAGKLATLAGELRSLVALKSALDSLQAGVERQLDDRDLALAMFNLWVRELLQQARLVAGAVNRPPTDGASLRRQMPVPPESSTIRDPRAPKPTPPSRYPGRGPGELNF